MRAPGLAAFFVFALIALMPAQSAAAVHVVQIKSRTHIALDPPVHTPQGTLVSGRVVDEATGTGVAGIDVVIEGEGGREITLKTGEDGSFAFQLPPLAPGASPPKLGVRFAGDRRYEAATLEIGLKPAVAPPVTPPPPAFDEADGPAPMLVGSTLIACAVAFFAVGAFIVMRARPLAALGGARRSRQAEATAQKREPAAGMHTAAPSPAARFRKPRDLRFAGVIADAVTGKPVPGATLALAGPGDAPEETLAADDAGRFARTLSPGLWQVTIFAPGYMRYETQVALPHHGQLADTRIDLLPVREKLFAIYREVAEPLLPAPDLWGIWSPRQIFDHVKQGHLAGPLEKLTAFIEEAYFSQRTPGEDKVPIAQSLARATRAT